MHCARHLLAALLVASVAACGGGGDDPAPPPSSNVGPAGATVTSADGKASLVVPAGALGSSIRVDLTATSDGFVTDPQIVPGSTYRVDAPSTMLSVPATFSIEAAPAAASGSADASAKLAQSLGAPGTLGLPAPLSCTPATAVGAEALPGTVCTYDREKVGFCPPSVPLFVNTYDAPLGNIQFPPGFGDVPRYFLRCKVPTPPVVQLVQVSPSPLQVIPVQTGSPGGATTTLQQIQPGIYGLLRDLGPPTLQLSAIVTPAGAGMGTLTLSANATDNVGVTSVKFVKTTTNTGLSYSVIDTTLAQFVAAPYTWTSAPMPLADIQGYTINYSATAADAAGNTTTKGALLFAADAVPAVTSFAATPATVPSGGGDVTLSWSVANAAIVLIDGGVGDVTGPLTSKVFHVTVPTTFTLTVANPNGSAIASAAVAVAPQPAPTIATFTATPSTLPAGGGAVTLAWTTTDADTLSIDSGVGVVTGTSRVVNVTAGKTFTLTATNTTAVTATKQVAVVVAASGDRFVDPVGGSDAGSCGQAAPCKTMVKAMAGAPAGAVVYLADGLYPATTQGAALTIADGTTLRATNPGAATLVGITATVAGSAIVEGVVLAADAFACSSINAQQSSGTPTLGVRGVLMKCLGALRVGGNVVATMTPGALAGGVYTSSLPGGSSQLVTLLGSGQLTIQGGVIDGNGLGGAAFGGGFLAVGGSAKLTLSGMTLKNRTANGISLSTATASAVIKDNTVIDAVGIAGNCPVGSVVTIVAGGTLTMDHAQVTNSPNAAVCVRSAPALAHVNISNSTLSMNNAGIAAEIGGGATAAVVVDTVSMTNNQRGVFWESGAPTLTTFDIRDSAITGNAIGLYLGSSGAVKLRASNVSNNTDAGVYAYGATQIDFGTQADAGLNTFTGNTSVGVRLSLNTGVTANAVGNSWNAVQQGADANGRYSVGPVYAPVTAVGPQSGKNYSLLTGVTAKL